MSLLWYTALVAAGYVLSIYTWPKIRTFVLGAEEEANRLRVRAADIIDAAKKF